METFTFEDASIRGIAIVFVSTDCPIANSYLPLLGRLADEYSGAGIRIFIVHPYPEVSVVDARRHAREFKIDSPVVIDNDQRISKTVGATVTPEVFVFVRQQKQPVYRGRIDNRYAGYGKKRRVATTHELADALDAVIAGQTPAESITEAIGCHISFVD